MIYLFYKINFYEEVKQYKENVIVYYRCIKLIKF